jgi:hypothetical protein
MSGFYRCGARRREWGQHAGLLRPAGTAVATNNTYLVALFYPIGDSAASNNWDPPLPATPQICPAALKLGDKSVNCFSFACDTEMPEGPAGVPVVTCHCAQGESFNAQPVPAHTAFAIQSAQTVKSGICRKYPIALPFAE